MRFSLFLLLISLLFQAANYAEANNCKSLHALGTETVADCIRNEAKQIQQESMLRDLFWLRNNPRIGP